MSNDTPLEVKLISQGAQQAAPVAVPDGYRMAPVELLRTIERTWRIPYEGNPTYNEHGEELIRQGLNQLRELIAAVPTPPAQQPVAWMPYLSDRADGVKGHYAIARHNPAGYREVWNLHSHKWAAFSEDVLTLAQALELMRQVVIPTAPPAQQPEPLPWFEGAPGKPWSTEWFIAETTWGDRVVLRSLPDEHSHDFTTADETYLMRDRIKRWAQFPDSEFMTPPAQQSQCELLKALEGCVEHMEWSTDQGKAACSAARAAIANASDSTAAPGPQRKFSGPGYLEQTGYIPAGSAAEREGNDHE